MSALPSRKGARKVKSEVEKIDVYIMDEVPLAVISKYEASLSFIEYSMKIFTLFHRDGEDR